MLEYYLVGLDIETHWPLLNAESLARVTLCTAAAHDLMKLDYRQTRARLDQKMKGWLDIVEYVIV